jgi:hypothetical protein
MIHHPRKPALLTVLFWGGLVAACLIWGPTRDPAPGADSGLSPGQPSATGDGQTDSLLRLAIQRKAEGRYGEAAAACRQVLSGQRFHREARFQLASSLALDGQRDALHAFLSDLVFSEAKLAVDVLERPECQAYLREPRFAALYKEAKSQAMD